MARRFASCVHDGASLKRVSARRLARHRNYIGAIERGEINPTFRVLLKVVHGLQVPLVELVTIYERHRMTLFARLPTADTAARTDDR